MSTDWTKADDSHKHSAVERILEMIGEDPRRPGLVDTPKRIVRSWATLYGGYQVDVAKLLFTAFPCEGHRYRDMVVLGGIGFYSMCEHHMLPFFGHAAVAYLPDEKLVGVSKLARVVDAFARRLQVQERLTDQVANAIEEAVQPLGVGVVVKAVHLCMTSRGVEQDHTEMVTSALRGKFHEVAVRSEFLSLVGM
ncbi:MAG TPA: GTP cyclohydrolase I FolE [Chloroflexi bacterium]|nr:GTP cyclohydrolase I FolE [Chloroflexota bacterium]